MYLKVRNIKKIILYIIAVVVTVMALYPLLWMIAYSLRLNTEIFKVPPSLIPDKIILSNYVTMVTGGEFGIFFGNSIFISLIATALVIIVSSLSAYGLSRFEFRGKRVFSFSIL